jgi:hypothetical protein
MWNAAGSRALARHISPSLLILALLVMSPLPWSWSWSRRSVSLQPLSHAETYRSVLDPPSYETQPRAESDEVGKEASRNEMTNVKGRWETPGRRA